MCPSSNHDTEAPYGGVLKIENRNGSSKTTGFLLVPFGFLLASFCREPFSGRVVDINLPRPESPQIEITCRVWEGPKLGKPANFLFTPTNGCLKKCTQSQGVVSFWFPFRGTTERVQQGSLHYTPEHCLVNGGCFTLF